MKGKNPGSKGKIKVAMIISAYFPVWGGIQSQLRQIGSRLSESGIELFILTRRPKGTKKYEVISGVPVYRLFATNFSRLLDSLLYTSLSLFWLLRNKDKYDILHCYQIYSPTTIGVLAKILLKDKVVITKVTCSSEYGEVTQIKKLPLTGLRIKLLKRVDQFLAVNEQIIGEMTQLGIDPRKIYYLPNGVEIPEEDLLSAGNKKKLRNKLKLPYENIAVFTGRISRQKNLDTLLSAWGKISALHPEAHLLILGEGSREQDFEKSLQALCKQLGLQGQVHFLGKVENVGDYLLASDIFILPSISEGLSNSLLEAMASGLGIIAGDNEGNRQLITHAENGLLVEPRNTEKLFLAALKLIEDNEYNMRLGKNARQTVKDNFSMEKTAGLYVDIYKKHLGDK